MSTDTVSTDFVSTGCVSTDLGLAAAATRALEQISDGARVGLGSGRAAAVFIAQLGLRVRRGLRVEAVPTSRASALQALRLGIPLIDLGPDLELDLTVDGADEVAPNLDLVKGRGGALLRERLVARASRRQIILVGCEKRVNRLGERGPLPVEVVPEARSLVTRQLRALGLVPAVRARWRGHWPRLTENGNLTLDCALVAPLADGRTARKLEATLLAVPGVVDTGLFLGTAQQVLVGTPEGGVVTLDPRHH